MPIFLVVFTLYISPRVLKHTMVLDVTRFGASQSDGVPYSTSSLPGRLSYHGFSPYTEILRKHLTRARVPT